MNTIIKIISLAVLSLVVNLQDVSASVNHEAKNILNSAFHEFNSSNYENAYYLFVMALSFGENGLGKDGFSVIRSYVYQSASKVAADYASNKDYSNSFEWIEKGLGVGKPNYFEPYDIAYPYLMTLQGICLNEIGKYIESYRVLSVAESEINNDKIDDEGKKRIYVTIKKYMKIVKSNISRLNMEKDLKEIDNNIAGEMKYFYHHKQDQLISVESSNPSGKASKNAPINLKSEKGDLLNFVANVYGFLQFQNGKPAIGQELHIRFNSHDSQTVKSDGNGNFIVAWSAGGGLAGESIMIFYKGELVYKGFVKHENKISVRITP